MSIKFTPHKYRVEMWENEGNIGGGWGKGMEISKIVSNVFEKSNNNFTQFLKFKIYIFKENFK